MSKRDSKADNAKDSPYAKGPSWFPCAGYADSGPKKADAKQPVGKPK